MAGDPGGGASVSRTRFESIAKIDTSSHTSVKATRLPAGDRQAAVQALPRVGVTAPWNGFKSKTSRDSRLLRELGVARPCF
jgi:hypothetical protein